MTGGVHEVAARGFASGADAYARGRPGYPAAIRDWLRDDMGIGPGSRVVEVGAGTGLFTQLLAETNATIIAVDPARAMLDHLHVALPHVETLVSPAEAIPLPDGSADAIVSATAFHWFATAATMREFRRLLCPGGTLGLVWNIRDERTAWVAELSAITNRYRRDVPRQHEADWRACFPAPGFSALEERVMTYAHRGTVEEVVIDRTLSTSFIAALDRDARAEVIQAVRALIARTPELARGGEVIFPYLTKAYRCRREA